MISKAEPRSARQAFDRYLKAARDFDPRATEAEIAFAIRRLSHFGWIDAAASQHAALVRGVKGFQKLTGLKTDGIIGPKTIKVLARSRCGHPDVVRPGTMAQRVKEWSERRAARWKKTALKWFMAKFVVELSQERQLQLYQQAWDAWSAVCGIRAERTTDKGKADVIASVGSGARSDFDGPGGTLAWAYLPDGDDFDGQLTMMFDQGETWTDVDGNPNAILYLNVACHEIGHLIGLDHSRKSSALMAPYYDPRVAAPQKVDDVPRAQLLYGPATSPAPPPVPAPPDMHFKLRVQMEIDSVELKLTNPVITRIH